MICWICNGDLVESSCPRCFYKLPETTTNSYKYYTYKGHCVLLCGNGELPFCTPTQPQFNVDYIVVTSINVFNFLGDFPINTEIVFIGGPHISNYTVYRLAQKLNMNVTHVYPEVHMYRLRNGGDSQMILDHVYMDISNGLYH
ncbi:hypothetical protein EB118_10865 [bacterium]|nr:hypothetical protein [bacterium]NDG30556.1 hypothetical protein [bacterium]